MDGAVSVRVAVLIDAENVPLWSVGPLLREIARYGRVQVKRAYGDWSAGSLTSWKKTLLELSIRPVQVLAAVKGKNAADLALVIDAMDLLHSGSVDGFGLVSSDSDFTRLAERIREAGLAVYGFGEAKKVNPGLSAACDTFTFVETLAKPAPSTAVAELEPAPVSARPATPAATRAPAATASELPANIPRTTAASSAERKKAASAPAGPPTRATAAELRGNTALVNRLREAVASNAGPDGWTHLSAVGQAIRKRPAVVLKTYGYAHLKDLLITIGLFEVRQSGPGKSGAVHARVR